MLPAVLEDTANELLLVALNLLASLLQSLFFEIRKVVSASLVKEPFNTKNSVDG